MGLRQISRLKQGKKEFSIIKYMLRNYVQMVAQNMYEI